MLDSLYGNLLGGTVPSSGAATMPGGSGGVGGNEDSPQPVSTSPAPAAANNQSGGAARGEAADDIFAQPRFTKAEPSTAPLPQSFSAAKLMMPPVRKKADPVGTKRPVLPSLDIHKLQEEKEALMRQRAAAEKKDDKLPMQSPTAAATAAAAAASARASPASTAAADESVGSDSMGASGVATGTGASAATVVPSRSAPLSSSLYGSPDEEYDPAKPNDYDEFCRRRMRQKAEEEMERRRQETLARQQQNAKPPEPKEDDFATKMLKKMGWKEGSGLGKEGQGMATPLILKKTDVVAGQIVEGTKREAPTPQATGQPDAKQPKAAAGFNRPPTRVLLLSNLVGAGEVDEDLEGETAEEAGKYGKLVRCAIKEIQGVPDDQAVRIFLQYERVEDATKALVDMNGRYFGGRVVKARFYDEQRFETGDLEKRDGAE